MQTGLDAQVTIDAAILDVGEDMALVLEPRSGRLVADIEASATAQGCELTLVCTDGLRERLRLVDVPLEVQRRLWFLLETEGVPVFEVDPKTPQAFTALAVLWSDRVESSA